MTTATTEETTALILHGQGYELTIAPEALIRKTELLESAQTVTAVGRNDESADAQFVSRKLAALRIEVEKCRKIVKEPVNRIGKLIDQTAKDFVEDIEREEKRIGRLVGAHAEAVERARQEALREEARIFEEARRAREAAEAAAAAAENTGKVSDIIAAKQAETARQEALAARMEASAEVAGTKVAEGVRFAWDFEVTDIDQLASLRQDLVTIEPKRSAILACLKGADETGADVLEWANHIGIRAFKKPVVSSR